VSILVCQTFDRMILGRLSFPGTRWYVVTASNPQMLRNQKKCGNHCAKAYKIHSFIIEKVNWFKVYFESKSTSLTINLY